MGVGVTEPLLLPLPGVWHSDTHSLLFEEKEGRKQPIEDTFAPPLSWELEGAEVKIWILFFVLFFPQLFPFSVARRKKKRKKKARNLVDEECDMFYVIADRVS